MSQVYDALKQIKKDQGQPGASPFPQPAELFSESAEPELQLIGVKSVRVNLLPGSLIVALSDPRSLGAEKFRALANRLENMRRQKEFKSMQVTSSGVNEGKTLVSVNLAITLANHSRSRVLLIEGDLHRPTMAGLLGLSDLKGLSDWWSEETSEIESFLHQLNDMPLWLLSAGGVEEQPSRLLQSPRLAKAFKHLAPLFDWIVVDSTPMLPITDANLWSRLVDGTLLVVREGIASVKALEKGLESLDNLKLIGTVLNESSECERSGYGEYYGAAPYSKQKAKK